MARMPSRPRPLSQVLGELIAQRGLGRVMTASSFEEAWRHVAGETLASQTRVAGMKRGCLEILVANSLLMQELVFQKATLTSGLQQALPDERITQIRFRVGTVS